MVGNLLVKNQEKIDIIVDNNKTTNLSSAPLMSPLMLPAIKGYTSRFSISKFKKG